MAHKKSLQQFPKVTMQILEGSAAMLPRILDMAIKHFCADCCGDT